MFALAVKAQLPLIAISTRDELNIPDVITTLTGKVPTRWEPQHKLQPNKVYTYKPGNTEPDWYEWYQRFTQAESTLIIFNPKTVKEPMFNAGEMPVPRDLMKMFMLEVTQSEEAALKLLNGLGGVTLKEAAEIARMTMARDSSLTVDGITETRRSTFLGRDGLTPVDTKQGFYDPPDELVEWFNRESKFFVEDTDQRLVPRGLLFNGPPGTGKTAGSKWLADKLGVPLYRLDVGATKSKWVGESEARLLTNLSRLDNEAPAVVLLDEIEKLFSTSSTEGSGTTSTMLSQLLWWLAERRSRILVIMTTNNADAIPRELYRDGRIDDVLWMNGLEKGKASTFIESLLLTFDFVKKLPEEERKTLVIAAMKVATPIKNSNPSTWAQATLTKAVHVAIKNCMKKES